MSACWHTQTVPPGGYQKGMTEFTLAEPQPSVTTGRTDFERDRRALTEAMSVLPEGGDIYMVVGQHNNGEYYVDAREQRCTCPDHMYRGVECKHIRRVAFATGERPLPLWVDRDRIDPYLGANVPETPRIASPDGGVSLDSRNTDDERPADCDCGEWNDDCTLPCWPCYREGFGVPNPISVGSGG